MSAPIDYRRHVFVSPASLSLAAAGVGMLDASDPFSTIKLDYDETIPSLDGAITWLNSAPLTSEELRGKVVAVDFWTYTCINWLRTLPYIHAWAERYRDQGLVVIGVHTPEFPFEHDIENVRRAVQEMRVTYPVAIDNDYAIWEAFDNHYWPALYLVDAEGHIRHQQFGEGDYDEAERVIQQLLAEAGDKHIGGDLVAVDAHGVEVAADWEHLGSGETYVGHERAENFASPDGAVLNEPHNYTIPARLHRNQWALSGDWTVVSWFAALNSANGRIAYRFHARDLHLVMGSTTRGTSVRFHVLLDGKPIGAAHGGNVDEQGNGVVREQRLHQLIRQPGSIADRTFEIDFLDPAVEAYAFTFG